MSDRDENEQQDESLTNPDVVTKYKSAAEITNNALAAVIAACKPGAKVVDVCDVGDNFINEACSKVFKGKDIEKGVAVPTCVSLNNVCGHFSPAADNATEIKEGDLVKIDIGCQIDGYITQAGHSLVVQADAAAPVTGRAADVIACAQTCFDAAARLIRPGKKISEVPPVLAKIAEAYGCKEQAVFGAMLPDPLAEHLGKGGRSGVKDMGPAVKTEVAGGDLVEGVYSHEMKRYVIDASKAVLNRPTPDQKVEDAEFEEGEVYAIDILVSSGEGKPKVHDEKETTVYKRALEVQYQLKLKASREVLSEISKKFPTALFTTRALKSDKAKFGLVECLNHGLLNAYPVTYEKPEALVAQVKGTVLLMPNGSDKVAPNTQLQKLETDKAVEDEEVKALLATSLKTKKKKKNKKDKEGAAETPAESS
ncbi:hypothetical protein N2152v2_001214 [Parachlorella kessleri]